MRYFRFEVKKVEMATDYDASGLRQQFALDHLKLDHKFFYEDESSDGNGYICFVFDTGDKEALSKEGVKGKPYHTDDMIYHTDKSLDAALAAFKQHPLVISVQEVAVESLPQKDSVPDKETVKSLTPHEKSKGGPMVASRFRTVRG